MDTRKILFSYEDDDGVLNSFVFQPENETAEQFAFSALKNEPLIKGGIPDVLRDIFTKLSKEG